MTKKEEKLKDEKVCAVCDGGGLGGECGAVRACACEWV